MAHRAFIDLNPLIAAVDALCFRCSAIEGGDAVKRNPFGWPLSGELALRRLPTRDDDDDVPALRHSLHRLRKYQRRLFAGKRHGVLLVVQGMDAAGKDSLIRTLARGLDPVAFRAHSFGRPQGEELSHDFLWRVWRHLPARGQLVAFNRSHYEAVLSARLWPVPGEVPDPDWAGRYRAINEFEGHLHREGTRLVKVWLNTSPEERRHRLLNRLDSPRKRWKFDAADLDAWRARDRYLALAEETLTATHSEHAPWYLIPNDDKHRARARMAALLASVLHGLAPDYPPEDPDTLRCYRSLLGGDTP